MRAARLFVSQRTGSHGISVMKADGSDERKLILPGAHRAAGELRPGLLGAHDRSDDADRHCHKEQIADEQHDDVASGSQDAFTPSY